MVMRVQGFLMGLAAAAALGLGGAAPSMAQDGGVAFESDPQGGERLPLELYKNLLESPEVQPELNSKLSELLGKKCGDATCCNAFNTTCCCLYDARENLRIGVAGYSDAYQQVGSSPMIGLTEQGEAYYFDPALGEAMKTGAALGEFDLETGAFTTY